MIGSKCLVDGKELGLVTGFQGNQVTVLMLVDSGKVCTEQLVDPERITMK